MPQSSALVKNAAMSPKMAEGRMSFFWSKAPKNKIKKPSSDKSTSVVISDSRYHVISNLHKQVFYRLISEIENELRKKSKENDNSNNRE